jgi:hypothetical protein
MMKAKSGTTNKLTKLPLISVIAAALLLSPVISMADKADRGHHKGVHSVNVDKKHNKGVFRADKHRYDKRGKHYKHRSDWHGHKPWAKHHAGHKHGLYKRVYNKHRHNDGHHHGHNHVTYIDHDHYYDDYGFDRLSFMLGLHSDNLDIIFHDY